MAKSKLKVPSDYSVLRIRIPDGEKLSDIESEVETTREALTKNAVTHPYGKNAWMNNHVLLEAIKIGLKELRKRK